MVIIENRIKLNRRNFKIMKHNCNTPIISVKFPGVILLVPETGKF